MFAFKWLRSPNIAQVLSALADIDGFLLCLAFFKVLSVTLSGFSTSNYVSFVVRKQKIQKKNSCFGV